MEEEDPFPAIGHCPKYMNFSAPDADYTIKEEELPSGHVELCEFMGNFDVLMPYGDEITEMSCLLKVLVESPDPQNICVNGWINAIENCGPGRKTLLVPIGKFGDLISGLRYSLKDRKDLWPVRTSIISWNNYWCDTIIGIEEGTEYNEVKILDLDPKKRMWIFEYIPLVSLFHSTVFLKLEFKEVPEDMEINVEGKYGYLCEGSRSLFIRTLLVSGNIVYYESKVLRKN